MATATAALKKYNDELKRHFKALYTDGRVLVAGDGPHGAHVMLVGEAPGPREALEGRPFVGKAGKNLDEFLRVAGLERTEIYLTNVVKFRPVKISAAGREINRTPTTEEIVLFTPWLLREIALVRPRIVVTLGNIALRAVSGRPSLSIGGCHGAPFPFEGDPADVTLFPLYHPASVIYNPPLREVYTEDLRKLRLVCRDVPRRYTE